MKPSLDLGRWYVRPDGSARLPLRASTRDGWAGVDFLQIHRRGTGPLPRAQRSCCSALSFWRWLGRGAVLQPVGWWPDGVPVVDLADHGFVPEVPAEGLHDWREIGEWTACRRCGNVRRADGANKPCKGVVRVVPR